MQEIKEVGKKNNEISKRRFEQDRTERERLNAQIKELEQQLEQTLAERDELKTRVDSSSSADLDGQLQALREEKADLERRLQELQAAQPTTSTVELEASLVSHISVLAANTLNSVSDPDYTRTRCAAHRKGELDQFFWCC